MKNSNFKKFTLRLTSFVLVLVTVMSVMCVSLMSASAQSADEMLISEAQADNITSVTNEEMTLDDLMCLLVIKMNEIENRKYIFALKMGFLLNELYNQYAGLEYDKEDVVKFVWEYYSENIKSFFCEIKQIINESGFETKDVLNYLNELCPEEYEYYMYKYYEFKEIIEN